MNDIFEMPLIGIIKGCLGMFKDFILNAMNGNVMK